MGGRWRAGMIIVAIALGNTASADSQQMVEVPGPPPPLPQALQSAAASEQVVASHDRRPQLSFDVATRGVCFDFVEQFGCTGGEQFGLGFKYGGVHAGILFGGGELHGSYLVLRPFVGGDVGTRYYTVSHRRNVAFSIAGRASLDLLVGVAIHADSGVTIGLLNTFGPNLRWDFGGRFGVFLRAGVGYFAGGTVDTPDSNSSGISFVTEAQLGMSLRL